MSLHPHALESVPEETARVARAAFPKGNPYLLLRDTLGRIFQDNDFAACFPLEGQPGLPPWRLALVTIMQFREHLADRHAAEAVRARIAWKYLLGLELTDPGFDFSVLSEFRDRLLASSAETLLLETCSGSSAEELRFREEINCEVLRQAGALGVSVAPAWRLSLLETAGGRTGEGSSGRSAHAA